MSHFNPYTTCSGCGKPAITFIESTSGDYGQCKDCLGIYSKTGMIQAAYFVDEIKKKIAICEALNNHN